MVEELELYPTKNRRREIDYVWPSGVHTKVVGYEAYVLDELLLTYAENDLVVSEIHLPLISYKKNKRSVYWDADVYIPKEKRIIEALPIWTYLRYPENRELKQTACSNQGLFYELWLYNSKGDCISKMLSSSFPPQLSPWLHEEQHDPAHNEDLLEEVHPAVSQTLDQVHNFQQV